MQERLVEVEGPGDRILDQEGVHERVLIEVTDCRQQVSLRGIRGNLRVDGLNASRLAGLVLLSHVTCARRIVSDQYGSEAGNHPLLLECRHSNGDITENCIRDRSAFQHYCSHPRLPLWASCDSPTALPVDAATSASGHG